VEGLTVPRTVTLLPATTLPLEGAVTETDRGPVLAVVVLVSTVVPQPLANTNASSEKHVAAPAPPCEPTPSSTRAPYHRTSEHGECHALSGGPAGLIGVRSANTISSDDMIAPGMEGVATSEAGFCAKCGAPRTGGANFCKKCGASLGPAAPGEETQQPHEAGGQLHGDHAEGAESTPTGAFHGGGGGQYQSGAPQLPPQYAAMPPAAMAPAQLPVPADGGQSNRLLFTLFVVFGLIAVVALVTVVFLVASHNSGQTAKLVAQPSVVVPTTPAVPAQAGAPTPKTSTPTFSQPRTPTPAPAPAPAGFPGARVTGRDGEGFNIGAGCSDNPSSLQPGCSDSPSAPSGSDKSCGGGLTVDSQSTSCGLAQSVRSNYHGDGALTAYSPERGASYAFTCSTGGPGTTHMTICIGRAGSAELYVRWG